MKTIKYIFHKILIVYEKGWAIIIVSFSALIPLDFTNNTPTICIFKNVTGHECPGCGMTRAFLSFFHGHLDFYEYNYLSSIVIPVVLLIGMIQTKKLLSVIKD